MIVLSIGSDRDVFVAGSPARERAESYARRFGEMHVVVFALKKHRLKTVHENHLHVYPTNSFFKFLYVLDAALMVRRLPGEVVTAQDPFEAGLAAVLGRRGRPLHMQLHTDPFARGFARSVLNRMRLLTMRVVLPRAKRIRVVSARIKERLTKRYPQLEVAVLPIYIDIQKLQSLQRSSHPRFAPALLWVGRFEREKNPELALRAFAAVAEKNPKAGLTMLGTGSLEQPLKRLAGALGVGERVEFIGWQDPAVHLAQTDLLLTTSHYEGYGRQIIEALAAGVPVLSTDVGVAREAGAAVADKKDFSVVLQHMLEQDLGRAVLANYPYKNFDEYVERYCADIEMTDR